MFANVLLLTCIACKFNGFGVYAIEVDSQDEYRGQQWSSRMRLTENEPSLGQQVGNHENDIESIDLARVITWMDKVPSLPMLFATSTYFPKGRCNDQVRRYVEGLNNSTLWAVQMLDASVKYPDGIINGQTINFGNFDQCFDLKARLTSNRLDSEYIDEVESRYCLVNIKYKRKHASPLTNVFHTVDYDPNSSAWDMIEDRGDFRKFKRHSLLMGLCVPAECSATDIQTALAKPLEKFGNEHGLSLEVNVKPVMCQSRKDSPNYFPNSAKIFCGIVLSIFSVVIGCTWYDYHRYSEEDAANRVDSNKIHVCFSARRNLRFILNTSSGHPGLDTLHAIRLYFMMLVILGHAFLIIGVVPVANSIFLENSYNIRLSMLIFNMPNSMDGVFAIGGLLLSYILLGEFDRSRKFNLTEIIFVRILRLTPLYALTIYFYATLLPYLGSGPVWKSTVGLEGDYCAENWWVNLFYLNNVVRPDRMCVLPAWYLAVDFHLYLMGTILLWIFWKLPRKFGYPLLISALIFSIAIIAIPTYVGNSIPFCLSIPGYDNPRSYDDWLRYYVKSHSRIVSYVVGILAGAIIRDHERSPWKLSKTWSRILFVTLIPICTIGNQLMGAKYYDPNYDYKSHPIDSAAYASLHRAAFALGTCAIPVLMTVGQGLGFFRDILTPRWVRPLSRLSYGVFLVHFAFQLVRTGLSRGPRYFSVYVQASDFVVDVVVSYGIALILCLTVEIPFYKISKSFFARGRIDDSSRRNEINTNALSTS